MRKLLRMDIKKNSTSHSERDSSPALQTREQRIYIIQPHFDGYSSAPIQKRNMGERNASHTEGYLSPRKVPATKK